MRKNSIMDISMRICFAVLVFFMATILIRFGTKQIFVEKLKWKNAFTEFVFMGNEEMGKAPGIPNDSGEITININWEKLYPFAKEDLTKDQQADTAAEAQDDSQKEAKAIVNLAANPFAKKVNGLMSSIQGKIDPYTGKYLLGYMDFIHMGKAYNSLIGCTNMPMSSNGEEVIVLNNGYMAYVEPYVSPSKIEELADNVAELSEYLDTKGIDFVYVNAGSKVCKNDKQLPAGAVEYTNERADILLNYLDQKGVSYLDIRPLQEAKYPDWYSSYYKTDLHWKNTTALWAAGEIAAYLNENNGFSFDLSYFDESNYNIEVYEDYFLGDQGRKMTLAVAGLEPFSKIIPKFETDLSIQIPSKTIDLRGKYEETLFNEESYNRIADYSAKDFETKRDAYCTVRWGNDPVGTVQNHLTKDNEGKRILMLQDSFSWWLSTYLALDVPEIDYLYLNKFTGSLKAYIEETKPDLVVLIMGEGNIKGISEAAYYDHTSFYDFR